MSVIIYLKYKVPYSLFYVLSSLKFSLPFYSTAIVSVSDDLLVLEFAFLLRSTLADQMLAISIFIRIRKMN